IRQSLISRLAAPNVSDTFTLLRVGSCGATQHVASPASINALMAIPQIAPALAGTHVRLEPLTREHIPALTAIGLDEGLWEWTVSQVRTPQDMADYVENALNEQAQGRALPFATVEQETGGVVGSTRFGSVDRT